MNLVKLVKMRHKAEKLRITVVPHECSVTACYAVSKGGVRVTFVQKRADLGWVEL